MRPGAHLRPLLVGLGLSLTVTFVGPALAQQVNPTANAVKEQQFREALQGNPSAELQGRITIPDRGAATLERPAGREWRAFHQGTMVKFGAAALLGTLLLLAIFYMLRGRIGIAGGFSGRTITRFNGFERFTHWLTGSCFIVLALSGLNVTFGKLLLLPIVGPTVFSAMSTAAKWTHNYVAWPFMLGVALTLIIWVKDNIPGTLDLKWLAAGGGIIGRAHPPAKRFNGGQKALFWLVVLAGGALAFSGINMLFPTLAGGVLNLQFWNMLHGIVAMVMIAVILGHIYIGTLGMEGAFDAMGSGEVDLNWAKHHHSLWVEDELRKGHVHGAPAAQPAE